MTFASVFLVADDMDRKWQILQYAGSRICRTIINDKDETSIAAIRADSFQDILQRTVVIVCRNDDTEGGFLYDGQGDLDKSLSCRIGDDSLDALHFQRLEPHEYFWGLGRFDDVQELDVRDASHGDTLLEMPACKF